MTQPSQTVCPRCAQPITFRKDGGTIYPHRDDLTRERCPMGGVGFDDAKAQVAEHRRLIREMAR